MRVTPLAVSHQTSIPLNKTDDAPLAARPFAVTQNTRSTALMSDLLCPPPTSPTVTASLGLRNDIQSPLSILV